MRVLQYKRGGTRVPTCEDCSTNVQDLYTDGTIVLLNTGEPDELIDGITSIEGNEEETIYNVAGQRLAKKQRGINIVNGRKILIK